VQSTSRCDERKKRLDQRVSAERSYVCVRLKETRTYAQTYAHPWPRMLGSHGRQKTLCW
jgi:hypothetical protein